MGLQKETKSQSEQDRVSQNVALYLRERIDCGQIPPGDLLPCDRELAETFDVTKPVARHAVRLLESDGYVRIRHGEGSLVLDPKQRSLRAIPEWAPRKGTSYMAMIELRRILEPGIAELAAKNATPTDAAALIDISTQFETCADEELADLDWDFHMEIASITGNPLVSEVLDICLKLTRPLRIQALSHPDSRDSAATGHMNIALAIAAGDPEEARAAMLTHTMEDAEHID